MSWEPTTPATRRSSPSRQATWWLSGARTIAPAPASSTCTRPSSCTTHSERPAVLGAPTTSQPPPLGSGWTRSAGPTSGSTSRRPSALTSVSLTRREVDVVGEGAGPGMLAVGSGRLVGSGSPITTMGEPSRPVSAPSWAMPALSSTVVTAARARPAAVRRRRIRFARRMAWPAGSTLSGRARATWRESVSRTAPSISSGRTWYERCGPSVRLSRRPGTLTHCCSPEPVPTGTAAGAVGRTTCGVLARGTAGRAAVGRGTGRPAARPGRGVAAAPVAGTRPVREPEPVVRRAAPVAAPGTGGAAGR